MNHSIVKAANKHHQINLYVVIAMTKRSYGLLALPGKSEDITEYRRICQSLVRT